MELWQAKEFIKCYEEPKYFVQKYVYVYRPDLGNVLAKPYPKMIDMIEFSRNADNPCRTLIVEGERQVGKTTNLLITALYQAVFYNDKTIHIHTYKTDAAKELINRFLFMYELLPEWLKPKTTRRTKTFIEFENGCRISAGKNSDSIRGRTINLLLFDESAWDKNFEDTYMFCLPTVAYTGKAIITSTRNSGSFFDSLLLQSDNVIRISREDANTG